MSLGTAAAAVLAAITTIGPVGVAGLALIPILGTWAAVFFLAHAARRRLVGRSFDVGGPFDQHYIRVLPDLTSGLVTLLYAAYVASWLTSWLTNGALGWLYPPWGDLAVGIIGVLVAARIAVRAATHLAKALWFGGLWLRLEGRGMQWHVAPSGDAYRMMWRRPSGEFLFDTTIRDHRLQQEMMAIRARRQRIVKAALIATVGLAVWWLCSALIANFYPRLPPDLGELLAQWSVPSILNGAIFLLVVAPHAAGLLAAVTDELVYRAGAQFIPGARVLGTRPVPISRKDVETQNAHGNADFVSAAEAVRRMTGKSDT